jgi:S-DNA-T family DNA segregation ATPase FtsK/SpoIIIE
MASSLQTRNSSPRFQHDDDDASGISNEIWGVVVLTTSLLLFLALISYAPAEGPDGRPTSWIGPLGSYAAATLLFAFGLSSYILLAALFAFSTSLLLRRHLTLGNQQIGGAVLGILALSTVVYISFPAFMFYGHNAGGLIGELIGDLFQMVIGRVGAFIAALSGLIVAAILAFRVSVSELAIHAVASFRERREAAREEAEAAPYEEMAPTTTDVSLRVAPVRDGATGPSRRGGVAELLTGLGARFRGKRRSKAKPEPVAEEASEEADEASAADWLMNDVEQRAPMSERQVAVAPTMEASVSAAAAGQATAQRVKNEAPAMEMTQETPVGVAFDMAEIGPVIVESDAQKHRKRSEDLERAQQSRLELGGVESEWQYPSLSFLSYNDQGRAVVDRDRLRETAVLLEKVLNDFAVRGKVTNICPGPVVTLFEFEPESGTKLSKIVPLSHDIAMALKAMTVRIIAPIPGKGCVGIEVPNVTRETVYLKELLADDRFTQSKSKLTIALGKDIEGFPVVSDLAKMPHLLVAGTTGSGKSVSVNGMLTSILYNASPDDVRMILIDPKQLEFAIYEGVPHLLLPVVTDPMKAATALQWAVAEMERRFGLMAEFRVRNMQGYNERLAEMKKKNNGGYHASNEVTGYEELLAKIDLDGRPRHRHMPYIVVVVDEFADLMMVAGKDVEQAIARLAQKARAAGIHVILATQRPSVDVITGLIKANFPTRISFRLMSGTDSRTVLDSNGAETLLGMGDMLFRPPGKSELQRVHGPLVDDREIEAVVNFLKAQRAPDYDESILKPSAESQEAADDGALDENYFVAVKACLEEGYASISLIQRRLGIGYNKAAKLMDQMEREGIVGPAKGGAGRRDIISMPNLGSGL